MGAWNGWYHVNGNTYGTWLRGDRRGWRARWHREHVEGDYKNPPAEGAFDHLHELSQRLLKGPPVHLNSPQRRTAGEALVEKLIEVEVELLALSVDAMHYHLLARFPDARVRWWVGRAKKNASHILRREGLEGAVWARKCRVLPITSRKHQLNVFQYITDHRNAGAWVWTFHDGLHRVETNRT